MDQIILRTADGNACSFWWDTAKNEVASKSAGRAIHDKVLMMKIFKPGDRDSQPHFMVERHFSDGSKKLFNGETKGPNGQMLRGPWREIMADQLKAWEMQTGDAGALNGTPLAELQVIDIAMAANLKAIGIHTLEALAEVPDSQLHNIGHNGRVLRDQAKNFLLAAAGNAPLAKMTADLAERDSKIEELQRQVAELAAKLDIPEEKRGPGRPRKAA
jgi:hypothetical protein